MNITAADRIMPLQAYFFANLNTRIQKLQQAGHRIIRLDMGSPDMPPAPFIIEKLVETVKKPTIHGYPPIGGTKAFKEAVANYYAKRFSVEVDPTKEVLGLIGSKEGCFHLAQVLLNNGDYVLLPDPGYPIYTSSVQIAGGEIFPVCMDEEDNYLPRLDDIPVEILERTKFLWLNYPNNPTGATANLEDFEKIVYFAKKYGFVIAHDAPYVDVCFEGYQAPSLLQVPGAKEVAVEFNSLSKTYNMAGWRVGMVLGNPQIIQYLHKYKSQIDSSNFVAIQEAAVAALEGDQTWINDRNAIYKRRRDLLAQLFSEKGFSLSLPRATIYLWIKLPPRIASDIDFCSQMLDSTGVSITPGSIYGKQGEGHIRISFAVPDEEVIESIQRLKDWL